MTERRRAALELLHPDEVQRIVDQALSVLAQTGVQVEQVEARALLADGGARIAGDRCFLDEPLVRSALATVPARFAVYDRDGELALDLGSGATHFDPGSAAIQILDAATERWRDPVRTDLAHLAWVTACCAHYAAQSTALVPADVPQVVADRYRLLVALRNSRKPVITGTFRKEGFAVMKELLVAVRGGEQALRDRPLAIFDCCPTPPLSWSDLTTQALLDAARSGIPACLISMPLGGATSPVTLREMVVQHCAESLSGVVLHQLAGPGAPLLWGGAPSAFDMRHGTTPAGAIETAMVDVANAQVGRFLGLPTHGYVGLSDSKVVDWQAGAETSRGLALAALGGVDLVAGAGILGFIGCQSLEKLVLDNEACGEVLRMNRGIGLGSAEDAPALLAAVVAEGHFLGNRHTRKHYRSELFLPRHAYDRAPYGEWVAAGAKDAWERARAEVTRIVAAGNPAPLEEGLDAELVGIVRADAESAGLGTGYLDYPPISPR